MNKGRFRGWMRRRMAKRLQRKLGLSAAQIAELMPIIAKMRRPSSMFNDTQSAELADVIGSESLDTEQLNTLVFDKLDRYKQTLDEQVPVLLTFMGGLDIVQRKRLQEILLMSRCCGHRVCRS